MVEKLDKEVAPYEDINIHKRHSPDMKALIHIDNSSGFENRKTDRSFYNRAGNVDKEVYRKYGKSYPQHPLRKMCTRPFRMMHFRWDGCIEMCCSDHKSEFIFGKFPEQSTEEIWKSNIARIVRKLLLQKKRYMLPCYKCDYQGVIVRDFCINPMLVWKTGEIKLRTI